MPSATGTFRSPRPPPRALAAAASWASLGPGARSQGKTGDWLSLVKHLLILHIGQQQLDSGMQSQLRPKDSSLVQTKSHPTRPQTLFSCRCEMFYASCLMTLTGNLAEGGQAGTGPAGHQGSCSWVGRELSWSQEQPLPRPPTPWTSEAVVLRSSCIRRPSSCPR